MRLTHVILSLLLLSSALYADNQRFISLAPNITEIIYAAGAGSDLVGASDFSNFPPKARQLPRVASYTGIDLERILRLKPTRVFYWQAGNGQAQVNQLKQLGITTQAIKIQNFQDVIQAIQSVGQKAGTNEHANRKAAQLMAQYQRLKKQYQQKQPVSVFYQVSASPLLTISQDSYINHLIQKCGGRNIIHKTVGGAPEVNIPVLLQRQPQAIIIGKSSHDPTDYHQFWQQWHQLKAVRNKHVFTINADWINRPGPRLVRGMKRLCQVIDTVRQSTKLAS